MTIGKPHFDTRPGVAASTTARIWIVATLCVFQYWLLTASLEAVHAGYEHIALPSLGASLVCFVLAAGLVLTGEAGMHKMEQDFRDEP
jgi:hypothetical protein